MEIYPSTQARIWLIALQYTVAYNILVQTIIVLMNYVLIYVKMTHLVQEPLTTVYLEEPAHL